METEKTDQGIKYLEISYEPQNGWIRCSWYGNVSMDYISKGSARFAEFLKQHNCPKLLNDNSQFEANWVALNDELEMGRMDEMAASGLRYVAHVHSTKFITRFSAVDLGTRSKDFEFKMFEQLPEAEEWLRNISDE